MLDWIAEITPSYRMELKAQKDNWRQLLSTMIVTFCLNVFYRKITRRIKNFLEFN